MARLCGLKAVGVEPLALVLDGNLQLVIRHVELQDGLVRPGMFGDIEQ
jgi:hypothetical protein